MLTVNRHLSFIKQNNLFVIILNLICCRTNMINKKVNNDLGVTTGYLHIYIQLLYFANFFVL